MNEKFVSEKKDARLALNKSLLKEYTNDQRERVVYLKDGEEFQIQLFNPKTSPIGIEILINGENLGEMLVIRPGERVWLERYFKQSKKFKFSTYTVDDSPEVQSAISKNGLVEIKFYDSVKELGNSSITFVNPNVYHFNHICGPTTIGSSGIHWQNTTLTGSDVRYRSSCSDKTLCAQNAMPECSSFELGASTQYLSSVEPSCMSAREDMVQISSHITPMETGRVEAGSYSSQKFSSVDFEATNWPYKTEVIHIYPESRKPMTSEDTKRKFCTECGTKVSPKFKFCPKCGAKL